jgi:hypothetical protein
MGFWDQDYSNLPSTGSGPMSGTGGFSPISFATQNPLVAGGLMGGQFLLEGLSNLLSGPSWGEKKAKEVFSLAKNRMGMDVLQPEQYLSEFMRANAPRFNMQAEGINRRLNLDSGVAQGEMAAQQQGPLAQFMLNAQMQNDMLKSQNDNMLMQLMGQLTGGR